MKALALLLTVVAGTPAALAGGVIVYKWTPPIQAEVGMDRHFVTPGASVNLRAAAPSASGQDSAYDQDTEIVDGNYSRLVDDSVSVMSWQVNDQNGVPGGTLYTTSSLSATWTAPAGLSSYPATYTVTMVVDDYAAYGSASNDPPATRTATIVVSPVAPVGYLSARPTGSGGITLEWNAPDGGATDYKIYRRTDPNTAYSATPAAQVSTTAWTDSTVTEGTTYYYQIQAANGGNDGPMSPEVIGTPESEQPTAVAYVANSLANNVLVVDTTTDQVYATIAVGKTFAAPGSIGPLGVAVSPDGSRVYVTNMTQETVSIIEAATNRELDIDGNSTTTDPLDSPPGISRVTLRTTEDTSRPLAPDGVLTSEDGQFVYVADFAGGSDGNRSGSIASINTSDNTVTKPIASGITHPTRLALTPDGLTMYAPDAGTAGARNASVTAVDVSNPASPYISATVSLNAASMPNGGAPRPQGVAVTQTVNGTRAYVVNTMGQSVSVIDTAANSVAGTITIPSEPSISSSAPYPLEAAASEDGAFVFVTGSQPGADGHAHSVVWVIDTSSNTVAAQQALVDNGEPLYGAGRIAVAEGDAGYKVYISNFGDFMPDSIGNRMSVLTWARDGTGQYALFQNPAVPTGDDSGPGGVAFRSSAAVSPVDVSAIATGSGMIAVYWTTLPYAAEYKIYRREEGQSYGQPIFAPRQPTYAGSLMSFYIDGNVVNGTRYYYTVAAILDSGDSAPSSEVSAVANTDGIPWQRRNEVDGSGNHTGASAILAAVRQAFFDMPFDTSHLMVSGPDGSLYFEDGSGAPNVRPPAGKLDPSTGEITFDDGASLVLPADGPLNQAGGGQSVTFPSAGSGPFRKVETAITPGYSYQAYRGVRGTIGLPSDDDFTGAGILVDPADLQAEDPRTGAPLYDATGTPILKSTKDIPYNYFGIDIPASGAVRGIACEGGLFWDDPRNGGTGVWRIYARATPGTVWKAFPGHGTPWIDNLTTFGPGEVDMQMGFSPTFSCYYVYAVEASAGTAAALVVYVPGLPNPTAPGAIIQVKRVHSIAQNLPRSLSHAPGSGYYRTPSYFKGTYWRNGQVEEPWGIGFLNIGFTRWGLAETGDLDEGSFPARNVFVSWLSPRDYDPYTHFPWETEDDINIDFYP